MSRKLIESSFPGAEVGQVWVPESGCQGLVKDLQGFISCLEMEVVYLLSAKN